MAEGLFHCIAATTTWDYKQLLEKDPALERRFPQVQIPEPSPEEMHQVLQAVIPRLEAHHKVHISEGAVEECIALSGHYLKSQSFPDKAIDLLDHAASKISIESPNDPKEKQLSIFLKVLIQIRSQITSDANLDQKIQETGRGFKAILTAEHIRNLVAEKLDLPLQKLGQSEKHLLANLEAIVSEKVIGQKKSISSLCQGVRRARLKLGNPESPAGVFLILGSTGVGKTATVQVLCDTLYGSREHMLRLDMSEYQHPSDVTKLIGAPPSYIGYGQSGILTGWLQKKPNSIVLIDEVEKAHRSIHDLFLQVFDAGRLTDGTGKTIRCQDTTFVMTSNIGANRILEAHNSETSEEALDQSIQTLLELFFRAEFLNRIQETTIFYPLSLEEIGQIAELQCKDFRGRVMKNAECPNVQVSWDDSLITFLVKNGYNPQKGARELARCVTRNMENPLADAIVLGKIQAGDQVRFTADAKGVKWNIIKPNASLSLSSTCSAL